MTSTKRAMILLLVLSALLVGAAGVSAAQNTPPPPQPTMVIRTVADDKTYAGVLVEYCWPVAADDINCGASPATPDSVIPLQNGDTIEIVTEGAAGPPSEVILTLLDTLDRQGEPVSITLDDPGEATEWTVDLDAGEQAVRIDALFLDVAEGSFISFRFTFEIRPPTPTPTPTEEPAEEPTEEPTETLTPEATEAGEGGEEETPATEMATEPTEGTTGEAATPEPTVTLISTGTLTTEVATEEPEATPTETPATAEPIDRPLSAPPPVALESAGESYPPLAVEFCWDNAASVRECPTPAPLDEAAPLTLLPSGAFLIAVDGPAPETVELVLLTSDGITELARESRASDVLFLYSLPIADEGSFVFAVEAQWPEGTATYLFQLLVTTPPSE